MDLWVVWIVVAALFAVGEIVTLGFFLAPFAVGALIAAGVDGAGASDGISIATFLVASTLALGIARPIARRHLRTPSQLKTGTDRLIGHSAVVLDPVTADGGTVKLDGEVWTARAYDEDEVIAAGARVQVIEIRGATALVSQ